ncbi:MAG: dTDP-4-dehydrorhamnose 3,5-epimerase [Deltaproteobacteria bacterium]|nr:MAG: dTDP-4-dehydrorhamnose 3,5-epimerase [Deltaproteobacteria bacterium]
MELISTPLEGVWVLQPRVFGDHRGWFMETHSTRALAERGLHYDFVQDNHSFTASQNTLRGLHLQLPPMAQAKLVRCTRGAIFDVAVDLRPDSPTYKQWFGSELSAENKAQLLIPKGFAHGFLTRTNDVEVLYKVDTYYSPEHDRSIRFDDPELSIEWGVSDPILSEKDRNAPFLKDVSY